MMHKKRNPKFMTIKIHKAEDFIKMRNAGILAAEVLDYITEYVKPEVTTNYLKEFQNSF